MKNLTYETIERRNRIRRTLFRSVLLALLLVACIAIAWFITSLGYEPLYESGVHHTPALRGGPTTPHALALDPRT